MNIQATIDFEKPRSNAPTISIRLQLSILALTGKAHSVYLGTVDSI